MTTKQNVNRELADAQVMVNQESTFLSDGLSDAGVTMADMHRGFTAESMSTEGRMDADGTNYVGNQYEREGFMEPVSKYSRL